MAPQYLPVVIRHRTYGGLDADSGEEKWKDEAISEDEPFVFSYLAACAFHTYVFLCTPRAKKALAAMALLLKQKVKICVPITDENDALRFIEEKFLPLIKQEFPMIYIDERMEREGAFGSHPWRNIRNNEYQDLSWCRGFCFSLDAWHVRKMAAAGAAKDGKTEVFEVWMFLITAIMIHEIGGHIFVSSLMLNRDHTPPNVKGHVLIHPRNRGHGESGDFMEQVFGGQILTRDGPEKAHGYPGLRLCRIVEEDQVAQEYNMTITHEKIHAFFEKKATPFATEKSREWSQSGKAMHVDSQLQAPDTNIDDDNKIGPNPDYRLRDSVIKTKVPINPGLAIHTVHRRPDQWRAVLYEKYMNVKIRDGNPDPKQYGKLGDLINQAGLSWKTPHNAPVVLPSGSATAPSHDPGVGTSASAQQSHKVAQKAVHDSFTKTRSSSPAKTAAPNDKMDNSHKKQPQTKEGNPPSKENLPHRPSSGQSGHGSSHRDNKNRGGSGGGSSGSNRRGI